jgi:flagellar hook protein FlgE
MNNALLSGITGLQAHQLMLDTTGNNLANMNTTAFKSGRVHFSELLNRTISSGSSPTENKGGTDPVQMTTGVSVSRIEINTVQGSISQTGRPLDMAIEGEGYFTLYDGTRNVYTRAGAFGVDSNYNLVDPSTGNKVQRMGSVGVDDGFQSSFSNDIRVPYDVALPSKVTETVDFSGNLSADEDEPTKSVISSGTSYTSGGAVVSESALLENLDQASSLANGDVFNISGTDKDGNAVNVNWTLAGVGTPGAPTVGDLCSQISAAFPGSTASVINGEIRLSDDDTGFSLTNMDISYTPAGGGTFELPNFFDYLSVGGQTTKPINVEIFDAQGISHTVSATFAKHDSTPNRWDLVLTGITGDVEALVDRRVHNLDFMPDGSYAGLDSGFGDSAEFEMVFSNDPTNNRTIQLDFGSVGQYDGLSQFGGSSTASPSKQDGYAPGWLSSLSVLNDGMLVGIFTNGVRRDIAQLRVTTFQNPAGLQSVGRNYFTQSANSGLATAAAAMSGKAGSIRGGALEKSNVDPASEFVNLIQAQNGYQASARTITVSNDMLRELSNLIR